MPPSPERITISITCPPTETDTTSARRAEHEQAGSEHGEADQEAPGHQFTGAEAGIAQFLAVHRRAAPRQYREQGTAVAEQQLARNRHRPSWQRCRGRRAQILPGDHARYRPGRRASQRRKRRSMRSPCSRIAARHTATTGCNFWMRMTIDGLISENALSERDRTERRAQAHRSPRRPTGHHRRCVGESDGTTAPASTTARSPARHVRARRSTRH